ncbi:cathepsin L1-like [Trichogramma pretiosum]|uniref:cathepsin L1-like n=1 Tax=Trichogramma pretiosum TaxID=7493 RepID=UPI0006C9ACAD|nr:cathepsin L1-like [Trichogramma pretiosum]
MYRRFIFLGVVVVPTLMMISRVSASPTAVQETTTAITISAVSSENVISDEVWNDFKQRYNKTYSSELEEKSRRSILADNKREIDEHNAKYRKGELSFGLKINQFGDLTFAEYKAHMRSDNATTVEPDIKRPLVGLKYNATSFGPDWESAVGNSVDWRPFAVTPVQNQGLDCGSCWAFAAAGALEGQYYVQTGELTQLSAQTLLDCTTVYGNSGCRGGSATLSYQYVVLDRRAEGLETAEARPYLGHSEDCPPEARVNFTTNATTTMTTTTKEETVADTQPSYVLVPEVYLRHAVATAGPIASAIDALHNSFRFYSEGVFFESECTEALDHAVLIVGYGSDPRHGDYWLVKNSWGTAWGESGYFRIKRDDKNHCGIATEATYPLVG